MKWFTEHISLYRVLCVEWVCVGRVCVGLGLTDSVHSLDAARIT